MDKREFGQGKNWGLIEEMGSPRASTWGAEQTGRN